jgi:nucleoside 2-deoxyribosyltransferase
MISGRLARGFFAFPSNPVDIAEIITDAIEKINTSGCAQIVGWIDLENGGRFIWQAIEEAIDSADLFLCDLTGLNHNVLFELGYAIARKKRIWPILSTYHKLPGREKARFAAIRSIVHTEYSNAGDIFTSFLKSKIFLDPQRSLYADLFREELREARLLYLKSSISTQASTYLTETIDSYSLPVFVDDPVEYPDLPLSEYAAEIANSFAVIVHFESDYTAQTSLHNAKCSLLSGLAHGLGKPLLMLAQSPFTSPVDYQDLLRIHDNGKTCRRIAEEWLRTQAEEISAAEQARQDRRKSRKQYEELQTISLGTYAAENERDTLEDYFVERAAYAEGLNANSALFIGRRGAGKTAIFLRLSDSLARDKRNLVIEVFPREYELDGLLEVFAKFPSSVERGYLIESLWKFLLYTEIARALVEDLQDRPSQIPPLPDEQALLDFVSRSESLVMGAFSTRLGKVIDRLKRTDGESDLNELRVSELLHKGLIQSLRKLVPPLIRSKNKVILLVDNLDKSWTPDLYVSELGALIFGLLNVRQNLIKEFQSQSNGQDSVNLAILVFLRSDIFKHLRSLEREADKIDFRTLNWHDSGLLQRIIEKRFFSSSTAVDNENGIWYRYFCPDVNGKPTKAYMVEAVLPRPRDIIFLAKAALTSAINNGHRVIQQEDMLEAERQYSKHALDALINENRVLYPALEDFLYELVGYSPTVEYSALRHAASSAGIEGRDFEDFIHHMTEQWFLGYETSAGKFEFLFIESRVKRIRALANRIAKNNKSTRRFQINRVFWEELGLTNTS